MFHLFVVALILTSTITLHAEDTSRIFQGEIAPEFTFPWMVSLRIIPSTHVCGGTILSESFILTAANCFLNLQQFPGLFNIQAGVLNLSNQTVPTEQIRNILQIFVHPSYNQTNFHYNLALVQLRSPLVFVENIVSNISLSDLVLLDEFELFTIGWGVHIVNNQTMLPRPLLMANVTENMLCTLEQTIDPNTQLCASGKIEISRWCISNKLFY